jgi:Tfp pilus assembly protein PilN
MLQVNLLPWRAQQRQRRKRFWLYFTGLTLMLPLLMALAWWWLIRLELGEQKVATRHWVEWQMRLGTHLKKVDEARLQLQALQLAAHQRQQRYEKSRSYLQLLGLLSRHIPDGVWLTQLTEGAGGVLRLQGESTVYHSLMAFSQTLREEPLLAEVRLLDMQRQPNHNLQFLMQLRLALPQRD